MNVRMFLRSFAACVRQMMSIETRSLIGQTIESLEVQYNLDLEVDFAVIRLAFIEAADLIRRTTGFVVVGLLTSELPKGGDVARTLILLWREATHRKAGTGLTVKMVLSIFLHKLLDQGQEEEDIEERSLERADDDEEAKAMQEAFVHFYLCFNAIMEEATLRPILLEALTRNAKNALYFDRLKGTLAQSLYGHDLDVSHLRHALEKAEIPERREAVAFFGAQKRGLA